MLKRSPVPRKLFSDTELTMMPRILRIAHAEGQATGGLLFDLDGDIDLIVAAWYHLLVDVTVLKKPSCCRRILERSIAACEYQAPSSWRISRRITSSSVRVLPWKITRRT